MNERMESPILSGCSVLPPMESTNSSDSRQPDQVDQGTTKQTKGKATRHKTADRFAVLNNFVDFTLAGLTRNEIAVWLVLYRDTKNGTARTSQADLARRTRVSDRTVRRAINRLKELKLLKVVYRGGVRRGASVYRVHALPPDG